MKTRFFMAALAGALLLPSLGAQAQTAAEPDSWKFSVMPYLWIPTVKATLNFDAKSVETKPDSYLDNLDFAGMLSGTARKGRWVIGSDLMYLHVSDSQSKVRAGGLLDTGGSIDLKGFVWTAAGGYSLILEPKANLDVIAGFRYFGLDTKVDTNIVFGRSVEKDANIWAGIIGARGRFNFGESDWFANGYVDVGGGSSTFTWQGAAGVGYAFKWGDVILDYRYLYYSQDDGKLIDNLSFGGLALGANFRF
jgi:opacity protein-like surface antigen